MKTNNSRRRILITCAGGSGPQYLAQKLKDKHDVFLTDITDQNYGPYLGLPFFKVPRVDSEDFKTYLRDIIERENIDTVVANSDPEVLALSKLSEEFDNVICVAPKAYFITLCLDKKEITQRLFDEGISALNVYKPNEVIEFPAVIKPNNASGSRGFHVVRNEEQMKGYFLLYSCTQGEVVIEPYIDGVEYTVSVIVNNLNQIIGIVPKRIILKKGITKAAVTEQNDLIAEVCQHLVANFKPAGPINVQLMLYKDKVYIFEVNPRLSTTVVLTDKAFGNEVELFLQYRDCEEIKNPPQLKEGVYLYRYDENFFVE